MSVFYKIALYLLLAVGLTASVHAQPQDATVTLTAHAVGVGGDSGYYDLLGRAIGGRLLFKRARYHAGDNPAWADPAFDDRGWEIADTRLLPRSLPQQGWPGIGWFRVRLRLDSSLRDQALGFVLSHAGAAEVYLDGSLIHHSGKVGATRTEEEPFVNQEPFVLPLEAGDEHVLAVRYSSATLQGFRARWGHTGFGLYWGEQATMVHHQSARIFKQGSLSAFLLAFALFFGLLYALYRSERLFLYISIFYGCVFSWICLFYQLPFVQVPQWVMPLLDIFIALGACVMLSGLFLVYAFFYETLPGLFYGFLLLGIAAAILFFVRESNIPYFLVFALLVVIELVRVVALAIWRRKRWAWIVGFGFVPFILVQVWERFYDLGLVALPWADTTFHPRYINILSLSIAMAVYVGIRFAEANKSLVTANRELAEANRTLEDKVARRTAKLEASQAQLKRSNEELEQFASVASHDLQEPLRTINSFVKLLEKRYKGQLDKDADIFIGYIVDGSERMQALIRDLLAFSRVGRQELERQPVNVCAVLQQTLAGIQTSLDEAGAEVAIDPMPTVEGDATQLGQVFQNLISNGIKFRGEAAPRVHVSALREEGAWRFSVKDNGIGIKKKYQQKIFEIFQRLHSRSQYEGTGIGLATCKKIVERHGGRIWVESEEGQGTTFYFTIPAHI